MKLLDVATMVVLGLALVLVLLFPAVNYLSFRVYESLMPWIPHTTYTPMY